MFIYEALQIINVIFIFSYYLGKDVKYGSTWQSMVICHYWYRKK